MAKKDRRLHQAAGAGGQGQSVAAHRAGAGPARPQHHGVLQGVQRADPEYGAGHADAGGHHRLSAIAASTFVTKTPPNSYFLLKAAGIEKGSQTPAKGTVGKVTMAQMRDIAEKKMTDLNAKDIDGACRMIVGSARSMGLEVVEWNDGERQNASRSAYEGVDRDRLLSARPRR